MTSEPTQHCTTCGTGPFFHVATRQHPELCIECSADADRLVNGWTPENSLS